MVGRGLEFEKFPAPPGRHTRTPTEESEEEGRMQRWLSGFTAVVKEASQRTGLGGDRLGSCNLKPCVPPFPL